MLLYHPFSASNTLWLSFPGLICSVLGSGPASHAVRTQQWEFFFLTAREMPLCIRSESFISFHLAQVNSSKAGYKCKKKNSICALDSLPRAALGAPSCSVHGLKELEGLVYLVCARQLKLLNLRGPKSTRREFCRYNCHCSSNMLMMMFSSFKPRYDDGRPR